MALSDQKFQEIDRINRLLPYADQLDAYADAAWHGIKCTFVKLIESKIFLTELPHVFKALTGYIQLFGHRFSKKEHIALINFCLSTGLCPHLDNDLADATLLVAADLLQSCNWTLRPSELQLNWKVFDNASISLPGSMDLRFCECDGREYQRIRKVLRIYKRFFPVSCIQEIWDEYRDSIYYLARYGPHEGIFEKLTAFTPIRQNTFDEINRVWLGDIFLLWYRYCEDGSLHQEIICLLGNIASFCPGRVDWEPHLDRVFNGLIKDMCIDSPAVRGDLSKSLQRLLTGYARILIWGIVPNSTVIPRMRNLFKILGNIYHPSTDSSSMLFFVTFCKKLLSVLVFRLRQELSRNSRSEEIYGKMPTWSRITVTQVDDVVDILLPLCLDASLYTRRSKSLDAVVACLDYLCLLRPRLFLPRLLTALEGGFELPELPMRVTRPLQALAESCSSITALRLSLCWSSTEMGRQPGDQVPLTTTQSTGAVSKTPKLLSPEDDQFLHSHIASFLYVDGRAQTTRILRCCLSGLDVNDIDRLQASVKALGALFLTTPMQDFSEVCLPNLTDQSHASERYACAFLNPGEFAASRLAVASLEIEELAVQVYTRLLACIQSINESLFLQAVSVESQHTEQDVVPKARETRILCGLTGLAIALGISASPVPRLRIRLVKLLTDVVFSNQWNFTIARLLNYQLLWLISGKRGVKSAVDENGADISDVALYAVAEFWPRFLRLFTELDSENGLTCRGHAEPRFFGLLCILPAYISAIVPSYLSNQRLVEEFIRPLIAVLSRLLAVSVGGSMGVPNVTSTPLPSPIMSTPVPLEPCNELALAASAAAGTLLHRLTAFSINFDHVDLLKTGAGLSQEQSPFINSPIWSPYVSWQELLRMTDSTTSSSPPSQLADLSPEECSQLAQNLWHQPSADSLHLAEYVVRTLFLPVLEKLTSATEELKTYLNETFESTTPCLREVSGLPFLSQQRQFLTSLITWCHYITVGLSEGLKPRLPRSGAGENLSDLCPELEVCSDQSVVLEDSHFTAIKLNLASFDLPAGDVCDGPLRERIAQIGSALLETISLLTAKFDVKIVRLSSDSEGGGGGGCGGSSSSSVVGLLMTDTAFRFLAQITCLSCFNENADEGGPFCVLINSDISHLTRNNLGANSCIQANHTGSSSSHGLENILPVLNKLSGPSTNLLSAYSQSLLPTAESSWFVNGHLPLAWLVQANRRHRLFVALDLARSLILPGHAGLSFTQLGRVRSSEHFVRLLNSLSRMTLLSNNEIASRVSTAVLSVWPMHRLPGTVSLVIRNALELLQSSPDQASMEADTVPDMEMEEQLYRSRKQQKQKAVILLESLLRESSIFTRLFEMDPLLWAEVWVELAKTALFRAIPNDASMAIDDGQDVDQQQTSADNLPRVLSSTVLTHRYADQETLNVAISGLFENFDQFPFRLHFPPFEIDVHPPNGWFRPVLKNARMLLEVFRPHFKDTDDQCSGGSSFMHHTTVYRRRAYSHFVNGLYSHCLSAFETSNVEGEANQQLIANSGLVACLFSHWPIPMDPPLSPAWEEGCKLVSPPPPPPPLGMVRMALRLLTSQQTEVVSAVVHFLSEFLLIYFLRFRPDDYIPFDAAEIARAHCPFPGADFKNPLHWPGLRDDNFGIAFDPTLDCLSNDQVFSQFHHIPHSVAGFMQYLPKCVWRNPEHVFCYPAFTADGNIDETRAHQWLRPRSDVDFSTLLTAEELNELRADLMEVANYLASPHQRTREFWFRLSRNVLYYHRSSNDNGTNLPADLSTFISILCDAFGPDPLLSLLEEYALSVLVPTSAQIDYLPSPASDCLVAKADGENQWARPLETDGVVRFVGPGVAYEIVMSLSSGAFSWPREARLKVFACVIPRLLVAIEAAALQASTGPVVDKSAHPALENVVWCKAELVFGNGGKAMDCPVEENPTDSSLHPSASQTFSNDQLLYRLLMSTYEQQEMEGDLSAVTTAAATTTSMLSIAGNNHVGGPSPRLAFAYKEFVQSYISKGLTYLQYLSFLWNFAKLLLADTVEEAGASTQCETSASTARLSQHSPQAGEQMEIHQTCPHSLYSRSDSPLWTALGGECPLCLARRLLPPSQRAFIFYNLNLSLVKALSWQGLLALAELTDNPSEDSGKGFAVALRKLTWNDLACSSSIWHRELAGQIGVMHAAALFDSIVRQRLPLVRSYSLAGVPTEHPLSSMLRQTPMHFSPPLADMLQALSNRCVVGQSFVLRRYLPLLVRDSIAVLLLRGVQPSEQSLALQTHLLSQSAEPLVPAIPEVALCSPSLKWAGLAQLKSRLSTLFLCLPSVLSYAFSQNPDDEQAGSAPLPPPYSLAPSVVPPPASRFSLLLLLTPLLADLVSTSNVFWTGGRSEAVANKEATADGMDDLDMCLGIAINEFGRLSCAGHSDVVSALSNVELMLSCIETLLAHPSWKTRVFGLLTIRVMPLANITAFWTIGAPGSVDIDARRLALGQRLRATVTACLLDPWIEVSRAASEALSCLIQYNVLKYDPEWVNALVRQSRTPLRRPGAPKPPAGAHSEADYAALRSRHAGLLGLCAFIRAAVHDTPTYLPAVIAEVAEHANDPQPIRQSVSDTLMAYSRSHQERWREDRELFSETQLDAYLSVVSSVSYYV
uniref:Proteasome activator complex subunit 4A n=1 Tax=Schistocephalus solidus TaxID=70667 RepID=A0A0X3PL75_SCHSO